MKVYINYADKAFKIQQDFALKMAKKNGCFDKVIAYTREDIDNDFYELNKKILDQARGGGYWLWKPYFIYKTLNELNDGDYLFYCDSGAFFLKSVDFLINELESTNQNIMGFELPLIEKQWTKKELLINMSCDSPKYYESNQLLASFMLIKKSKKSLKFIEDYLSYSLNEMNITDLKDDTIEQYPEFDDHRHDQSIFSLLYKKYDFVPFKDPTQLGKYPRGYSASNEDNLEKNKLFKLSNGRFFREYTYTENYQLILYHNKKGKPIISYIKYLIKELLYKIKIYHGLVR